jgi:hypothetical protein
MLNNLSLKQRKVQMDQEIHYPADRLQHLTPKKKIPNNPTQGHITHEQKRLAVMVFLPLRASLVEDGEV